MASTSDFKNGLCIEFNKNLYTIVQFQHVKPGKGPAFVRTKLKSLITGRVIENTFSAGVKINVARIERRKYQFLYKDDMGLNLMHTETYEQIIIQETMIEKPELFKEGTEVEVVFHADTETPLTCELPPFVIMDVTYTEPGVKGDTSSSTALKPATLDTGAIINVPLFVNEGDKIKIDTRTGQYVERVK
ncbi:MAG: elongation factor P [Bacteroidetes bacterium]|jgi:elongation factor P|nr:elongation factor P [Bacteroidota bacterium]MBT6685645.1 elongation factor P [Bacteroidota bacterium]MBT7141869.1 elongation factor P [Bacteroidota bacterium]MBT7491054.1 elongation factor P [Bacteroidota bacterium]